MTDIEMEAIKDPSQYKKNKYHNIEEQQNTQRIFPVDIADEIHDSVVDLTPREKIKKFLSRHKALTCGLVLLIIFLLTYREANMQYYYQIQNLKQIKQLPFCLMTIPSEKYPKQILQNSIKTQNYQNHIILQGSDHNFNYYLYKKQIKQKCKLNTIVMFVDMPLKLGALKYLNQNMNKYRAWVFYAEGSGRIEIIAFYYRVYQLLGENDFMKSNSPYLAYNNREVQTLSFLELCDNFKRQISKQSIYQSPSQKSYFHIQTKDSSKYTHRTPYQKILRLSQDFPISSKNYQIARYKFHLSPNLLFITSLIKKPHMLRSLDRQQLIYLPQNHPIQQLQHQQFIQKYNIDKYTDISKQVRFCVSVLTRNNIQNNRYIKVLKSIIQQKYDNYHIVFIDDNSTDATMQKTIQYMKQINFPQNRIKYVQNLKRNYATYNIINAAFNYCHEDDIQMLIDGDDQFIGRYAFHVINSVYQEKKDVWVVYSNLKNNYYVVGLSRSYTGDNDHIKNGKRLSGSFIGPIRTWRVKLIYNIPIQNHKLKEQWIDMAYDDSLAHPLIELARYQRTYYVPEVLYQYNTNYGDNDNSNQEKLKRRLEIYNHVLSLPVLGKLDSLEGTVKQKNIGEQLKGDRGIRYKTLQL